MSFGRPPAPDGSGRSGSECGSGPDPAEEPVEIPVDGVLDLHTFAPAQARELVLDYLEECRKRRILEVRIIHGRGSGTLRRMVHAILERHPHVIAFRTPSDSSGWGATVVTLEGSEQT